MAIGSNTGRREPVAPHGVIPVFQTPMDEHDDVDLVALRAELDWLVSLGVDGLAMGMVSEILRLSDAEAEAVARVACDAARNHGLQCVLSVGAESTRVAVRRAQAAVDLGATALMAIAPLATALDDHATHGYYCSLLDAVEIPVIVQDASGYVGAPLSIGLQANLQRSYGGHVAFKPEAPPLGPRITELLAATDGSARILEGTGGIGLVDAFQRGVVGTMPGADVPWAIIALWQALRRHDQLAIDALHAPLVELISMQEGSLDRFLAIEKYLLVRQGVIPSARVRGPVAFTLPDNLAASADRSLAALRVAVRAHR